MSSPRSSGREIGAPADSSAEYRTLVYAPTGDDALQIQTALQGAGLGFELCADVATLFAEVHRGCGVIVLAEAVLASGAIGTLVNSLEQQPAWSDMPIVLISGAGEANRDRLRRLALLGTGGNVTLLERPFHSATLVSSVETALRARRRQYQIRKLLGELQESEARFRKLSDSAPVMIWLADELQQGVWFNRAWLEFAGRPMSTELGDGWRQKIHPDDRERVHVAYDEAFAARKEFEVSYRLQRHDGEWRWILDHGSPLQSPGEDFGGYIGSCTDVTAIKESERALEQHVKRSELISESAAQLLLTNSPQLLLEPIFQRLAANLGADYYSNYLVSEDGRKLRLASSSGLTEKQRSDLAEVAFGQGITGTVAQQRVPIVVENASASEWQRQILLFMRPLSSCLCHPIQINDQLLGTVGFAFSHRTHFSEEELRTIRTICDLVATSLERRRLMTELGVARDAAERANRAKDDFLATLSHELRTPLNPVMLVSSAAMVNRTLPEDVRADFEMIERSVLLEARLIDDLLDLTRIARGKLTLDLRPLDLHALLREAIATIRSEVESKHLTLEFAFDAPRATVFGDPLRLQQVFWNVIKNAVKFTPQGGRISVRTRMTAREDIEVAVSDSGEGMTSGELDRAFEAFSQGDHASANAPQRFGGLGLGLSISRALIDRHSGRIWAESEGRGKGTTVFLELPLMNEVVTPSRSAPPIERERETPPPVTGHILLVEDHEPTRLSLERLLTRRGYTVRTADSVTNAKARLAAERFDVLVSDLGLPDGTGGELMEFARDHHGLKGVALSGYGMEHDISRSRRAGFAAHLIKPVTMQSLENILRDVLGKR